MTSGQLFFCVLSVAMLLLPTRSGFGRAGEKPVDDSEARWVKVYSIGDEYVGMKKEIKIDDKTTKKLFAKDRFHLHANWRKEITGKIEDSPDAERIPDGVKESWIEAKDKKPYATVLQFSEKELIVLLVVRKGNYLWHHYQECLARLRIPRSKEVDAFFDVRSLEKTYGAKHKGLKQGDSVEEVMKKLGKPDATLTFQAVGFEKLCYFKEDVVITVTFGQIQRFDFGVPKDIKDEAKKNGPG